MSRNENGERNWSSECTFFKGGGQVSHTVTTRKLEGVRRDLVPLKEQGKVEGFFNNTENADKLAGLVEDIRDAIMEYQVFVRKQIIPGTFDICTRRRCSKTSTTRAVGSS